MMTQTEHQKLVDLLVDAGFDGGWVLQGELLTVWEHEAEPPKPLKRPK
jgi:hypothetical protein